MATVVVVPNVGLGVISAALAGLTVVGGWGTGATTAAIADTGLQTEDAGGSPAYARQTGANSQATVTKTNDTLQVVVSITANAGKTIREVALFVGSICLVHASFSDLTVDAGGIYNFVYRVVLDND